MGVVLFSKKSEDTNGNVGESQHASTRWHFLIRTVKVKEMTVGKNKRKLFGMSDYFAQLTTVFKRKMFMSNEGESHFEVLA